jgi:transposase-like protein
MPGRRTYTPEEQARVALLLQANEGNVKRTARETHIPPMTVRDWKLKWEAEGYPEPIVEALPAAVDDVTGYMDQARSLAVDVVIEKLREGKVSAKDAAWIASVFSDKINLIRGLATSRSETIQVAPVDHKELARELATYVAATVEAAQVRHEEIEDAEWSEQAPAALPAAQR